MPTNSSPRHLYWDACVFIDFFGNHPTRGTVIAEVLRDVKENPNSMIYTSIVTMTEVNCLAVERLRKKPDPNLLAQVDYMWSDSSVVTMVEFNPVIARIARDISRYGIQDEWRLKPLDSIHLATAAWLKRSLRIPIDEIHTYDGPLEKYADFVGIKIVEPNIAQPSLGIPGA